MYTTNIQTWGNSQGLRIPQPVLKQAGVAVGDHVVITAKQDTITIRKSKSKKTPSLEELVAKIPKGYIHQHDDMFGKPVGKEVW